MSAKTPTSFIFFYPEGDKSSEDMTREELLRVIEYLQRALADTRAQAKRDLDFISGCFKR